MSYNFGFKKNVEKGEVTNLQFLLQKSIFTVTSTKKSVSTNSNNFPPPHTPKPSPPSTTVSPHAQITPLGQNLPSLGWSLCLLTSPSTDLLQLLILTYSLICSHTPHWDNTEVWKFSQIFCLVFSTHKDITFDFHRQPTGKLFLVLWYWAAWNISWIVFDTGSEW